MAVLGSLTAILRADTRKFKRDFSSAQRTVSQFRTGITTAIGAVGKIGALMGGISAAGIAFYIKRQGDAVDATAKLADRVNATTEGLVGLQHAAEINGASVESLNKGMEFMTKSLGEAATGVGEARYGLEALGLELSDLNGLKADEQFIRIAAAMSKLESAEQRAFAATKLFGRGGLALVNTLMQGERGLRAMREEADRLGLTFSRVDAAKVEQANDAMTRMGNVLQGIGRTLAIELAPLIEAAADSFTDWATEGEGASAKVREAFGDLLLVGAKFSDVLQGISGVFNTLKGAALGVAAVLVRAVELAVELGELMVRLSPAGALPGVADMVSNFEQGLEDTRDWLNREMEKSFEDAGDAFGRAFSGRASKEAEAWLRDVYAAADDANAAWSSHFTESMTTLTDGAENVLSFTQKQRKEWTSISSLVGEAHQRVEDMRYAQEAATEAVRDAIEARREEIEQEKELQEIQEAKQDLVDRVRENKRDRREAKEEARDRLAANAELSREIELMRASNEFQRERIRIEHERERLAEGLADDVIIEAWYQERLADLAEREAESRKKATDESKKLTDELRKQGDITKRFEALPGSGGLFGFGAGRVGGFTKFFQPSVTRRQTRNAAQPAQAPSAQGVSAPAVQSLADLSPDVREILNAWKRVPPLWEKLGAGIRDLKTGVISGVERMSRATEQNVGELRDTVRALRVRVDAFEKRLSRASAVGPAGG